MQNKIVRKYSNTSIKNNVNDDNRSFFSNAFGYNYLYLQIYQNQLLFNCFQENISEQSYICDLR